MKQVGRYEIIEEIGRGGFATVYKARDSQLNRLVALKVLHHGLSDDPDFVRRFYHEAQTAAQFNHPNIVTIYDVGEIEGRLFISMELIPGQNLQQWLEAKGRPLTVAESLPILQPLANALDYAHKQGVVHRDIKPGNVMIDETEDSLRLILTDFGLVKAMEKSVYLTTTNRLLGTPEYMAPEQTDPNRRDEIGPHTDRYAFGILAYRMLAGRVPFPGSSISTLHAHANLDVPSPQQFNSAIPEDVVSPLLKMLAKKPENRFPMAAAFIEALIKAQSPAGVPLHTPVQDKKPDDSLPAPLFKASKALPKYLWAVGGIVGILLFGIVLVNLLNLVQGRDDPTRETEATATLETAVAGLTANNTPASTLTSEAQQLENQNQTATAQAELLTATAPTPTLTAAPTLTLTPQPTTSPTLDSSIPPPNPTLGSKWTRSSDNMIMVYIPAGTFLMGSDLESDPDALYDEFPKHLVTLDSFWIDRTEVTNEQYNLCVQDGTCDASEYADTSDFNGDTQPVVGVTWFNADNYCTWAGGQLPTEAQWEYAARGDDGRLYPWGDEPPTCNLAQFDDCGSGTVPVGSLSPQGDSWIGAADMAGNVWEWVQDWHDGYYYENSPETNPTGPDTGEFRVMRGGSWVSFAAFVRSAYRNYNFYPTASSNEFGFRCAVTGS